MHRMLLNIYHKGLFVIAPIFFLALALLAPALHAQAPAQPPAQVEAPSVRATGALTHSVVKVFSTSRAPDTFKP